MSEQIVKVQVPLGGHGVGSGRGLVYAEGRKRMQEQPLPEAVVKALNGDPKGYFKAHWSGTVGWAIGERVADQAW